jgi:hypothetical protein
MDKVMSFNLLSYGDTDIIRSRRELGLQKASIQKAGSS